MPPALVSADGGYFWAPSLNGGLTVLELPSHEEAVVWARLARACRRAQELGVLGEVSPRGSTRFLIHQGPAPESVPYPGFRYAKRVQSMSGSSRRLTLPAARGAGGVC